MFVFITSSAYHCRHRHHQQPSLIPSKNDLMNNEVFVCVYVYVRACMFGCVSLYAMSERVRSTKSWQKENDARSRQSVSSLKGINLQHAP